MSIESDVFKRAVVDFEQLEAYGFKKQKGHYTFKKNIMNNQFCAEVYVDERGKVTGAVYDVATKEEYTLLRVEGEVPAYVEQVRNAYIAVLEEIRQLCCHQLYFMSPQANRLCASIQKSYGDTPDFPWDKWSGYGVFRNPQNDKWYVLIANVDHGKLDKKKSGEVEIINLKIKADKIATLLKHPGFYPAYHMNKKTWITIILDDTLPDVEIMALVHESHQSTAPKRRFQHIRP